MRATIRLKTDDLDRYRRAAGLVHDVDLAERMGVHAATLSRTLRGRAALGATFIAGLLAAFPQMTFEDLFEIEAAAVEFDEPGAA